MTPMRIQAAVLALTFLAFPSVRAAAQEGPIAVDEIPHRWCSATRLNRELVIQGTMAWSTTECKQFGADGHCVQCEATPMLLGMDAPIRVLLQQERLTWGVQALSPAHSCHDPALYPYEAWKPFVVRGLLSEDTLDRLFTYPIELVLVPTAKPQAVVPDQATGAITIERFFEYACDVPTGPVSLRGLVQAFPHTCTEAACSEINPCCNFCDGVAVLSGNKIQIRLNIEGMACSGNECAVQCPGLELGSEYVVTGRLRASRYGPGSLEMDVESYRLIKEAPDAN